MVKETVHGFGLFLSERAHAKDLIAGLRIVKYFCPQLTAVRVSRVCWPNRLRPDSGQPIVGVNPPPYQPIP